MSLTVLSVAYPFAPVTPDPPGGAEQVLAHLDRALVDRGHRSIVVAQAGSLTKGELIAIPAPPAEIDQHARTTAHRFTRDALRLRGKDADIVHLHGIDFDSCLPPPGPPVLVTLHMPIGWYPAEALKCRRPRTWLQPVSASQARAAPEGLCLLPPIGNGVNTDRYRPAPAKRDFALVLGRIAPEKGFADAIEAARIARVPLIAAGPVFPYPEHRRYLDEEVIPRLDDARRWVGPVSGATKRRLLSEASCLLVPSSAPETSSLVAMEALACGTPVIAYRAGALPEVIEDGVTGILVDTVSEMADAISRVRAIAPAACRHAACTRFPLQRTTDAYLDLYARLAA